MVAISILVIFGFIIRCYNIVAVRQKPWISIGHHFFKFKINAIRHVCLWALIYLTNEESVCKTSQLCYSRV